MNQHNLASVWSAKWRLAFWTLIGLAASGAFVVLHQPQYEVEARLLVERGPAPLDEREPQRDLHFIPTQAEIVGSPTVVNTAADRVWASEIADGIERPPLAKLLGRLSVDPLVGTSVLSIRFVDENAEIARRMVEEILVAYREFLVDNERDRIQDSIAALEQHLAQLKLEEEQLLDKQVSIRVQSSRVGSAGDGGDMQRDLVSSLVDRISEVRGRRLQLTQQLESLDELFTPLRTVSVSMNAAGEEEFDRQKTAAALEVLHRATSEGWAPEEDPAPVQKALLEARLRETELIGHIGPKHSAMIAVRSRIAALEQKLARLARQAPDSLRREVTSAMIQEEELTNLYEQEIERVKLADEFRIQEQRALDRLTQVRFEIAQASDQLVQRNLIRDANTGRAITVQVRILESPSLVSQPLMAAKKVVLGLGGGFGLLGGLISLAIAVPGRREDS